jgi:flagellar hook-basal body complex protein FliE
MSSAISGLGAIGTISPLPKLSPLDSGNTEESFSGVLTNALQQVNQLSSGAEQQIGSLLNGGNTDVSSVMIAVEKADVAFQLMMQVRNKIVSAYQDIEKMQF